MNRRAREVLARLNVEIDPRALVKNLSTAEKQLVEIAKALASNTRILIMDEPTSALDPRARRRVIETLRALSQPLILTTHDLDMALDVCSRAALLYDGAVAAEGPLPDLFRDKELLERNGLELPLRYSAT